MDFRQLRTQAGLTQAFVAKKLDLSQGNISHWDAGHWAPPRKYRKKLAKLYGVSEDQIEAMVQEVREKNRGEGQINGSKTE